MGSRGQRLFLTSPAGAEPALKAELRDLGLSGAKAARGGVHVRGGDDAMARLCLRSRVAGRVLLEIGRFACPDERALYRGVGQLPWERWLTPDRTLAVTASSRASELSHTHFIAQKTKDAIVDGQRRETGTRSSVDVRDPDVGVFVRIDGAEASVFLDASGGSLHRRGWRVDATEAPLKEHLAAAILRLSGWDRESPLVDPTCGSGTIPIEAWLWAQQGDCQPPSRRFGFQRWADHDDAREGALDRARARPRQPTAPLCKGSDVDPTAIEAARANAARAGAEVELEVADYAAITLPPGAHVVMNPPYGERLEVDEESWRALEAALDGWSAHPRTVLVPEDAPRLALGPPVSVHRLFNGPLRCRLLTWAPREPRRPRRG